MKIRIATAQIKPTLGNIDANMEIAECAIREAKEKGVQLLVFPELGLTFWGGSEIIDPDCEVAGKAGYLDEDLLVVDIDPAKVRRARMYTPVRRDERIRLTIRELRRIAKRGRPTDGD